MAHDVTREARMTRQPIAADRLVPGMSLPGPLYDDAGIVVAKRGTVLNPRVLRAIKKRAWNGLFIGSEWPSEFVLQPAAVHGGANRGEGSAMRAKQETPYHPW